MINYIGNLTHGDDLGFIFNRNTITGDKISDNGTLDAEDEYVTEIFTDMIANFVKNGTLNIVTNDSTWISEMIPKFSDNTNSFISITAAPKNMNNFR
jgi:hypothetical protein